MSVARAIRANYADLRGWAIFAQLFLGVGWLRACVAHALERRWWDGSELTEFVTIHTAESVDAYRPFVEELVMRVPAPISWAVLALELVAAVLLISNIRAEIGLTIGGFLNVQFILAGQVNPSVFYLVAAIGLLLWRLEKVATQRNARYHTRRSIALAVLSIAAFGPSIRTVDPALAMEDPALVIIFLACLTAATIWLSEPGHEEVLVESTEGDDAEPMVLNLQDLDRVTIETTLPMMLSLKQMEGNTSIPRRQRPATEPVGEDAPDDEQQPRIRDLAPRSIEAPTDEQKNQENSGDNSGDESGDGSEDDEVRSDADLSPDHPAEQVVKVVDVV